MGVFSRNTNPMPFKTGPITPDPTAVPAGPAAAPNKAMDIRSQASRVNQQKTTPRQVLWNQMMTGSAAHKLVTHRALIDRFIDGVLYGSST